MADQVSGLLSPFLRRRRVGAVRGRLRGRVLDFGCGSGSLASLVGADRYLGVDIDHESIDLARAAHPHHAFELIGGAPDDVPPSDAPFDTIVMLALIEHVPDPAGFVRTLAGRLAVDGCMLLTTPSPAFDWAHRVGAPLGLLSREAADEHEDLLGRSDFDRIAADAALRVVDYRRFLLGANQLIVLGHRS